ncbi:alpha-amylase family protein [Bacteroidota bacterium]
MKDKIIIYQALPRIFGNTNDKCIPNSSYETNGSGKFNSFSNDILKKIKDLGCTHIWYTGVIKHATRTSFSSFGIDANHPDIVKGEAGSPYSITDYYDVAPSLSLDINNRIEEFISLCKRSHNSGLKVIIDFVPNHVSREYYSEKFRRTASDFGENDNKNLNFHKDNNFYYLPGFQFKSPLAHQSTEPFYEYPAKVTGNDCFNSEPSINDWFETVKLNYGKDYLNPSNSCFDPTPDTWYRMESILLYWLSLGVDGFRCDMAGMVPSEFWSWIIKRIKGKYPETVFIGELYEKERYRVYLESGFDYLYDKVGLYDTLIDIFKGIRSASDISYCWQSLEGIENQMLNFIENHDECRCASDFIAGDPYKAVPMLVVSLMLNCSPFLIYFGQELGERGMYEEGFSRCDGKTSIYDYWSLKTVRDWISGAKEPEIRSIYKNLLNIALKEKAICLGDKFDLQYANTHSEEYDCNKIYSFFRKYEDSLILIVVNFSDRKKFVQITLPEEVFTYLNLQDNVRYKGTDLLSGKQTEFRLYPGCLAGVEINGFGARIIRLSL